MKLAATLAVAAASLCLASAQTACPGDFVPIGNVCLYFVPTKGTWQGMKATCEGMSARLAILTGDLHQQVIQYINAQGPDVLDDEAFWIGGTDEVTENVWKWIDGTDIPLGGPHWYPCNGQPNGGTAQNYLALYTPDFYFHSLEGTRQIRAICQF